MGLFSVKRIPESEVPKKPPPRLELALAVVRDQKQFANLYTAGGPKRCREEWPALTDYDVTLLRDHYGLAHFKRYPAERKLAKPAARPLADAELEQIANRVAEILLERLIK